MGFLVIKWKLWKNGETLQRFKGQKDVVVVLVRKYMSSKRPTTNTASNEKYIFSIDGKIIKMRGGWSTGHVSTRD